MMMTQEQIAARLARMVEEWAKHMGQPLFRDALGVFSVTFEAIEPGKPRVRLTVGAEFVEPAGEPD